MLEDLAPSNPPKEWCPDAKCSPGFTLVQFRKRFKSEDAWDVQLTSRLTKVLIIFSFAIDDPTEFEMLQHAATSTGYGALLWNRTFFHEACGGQ